MKKIISLAVIAVMVVGFEAPAFATSFSLPSTPITASVDGNLTLTATLFKDSAAGPTGLALSAINFGQLQTFTNTSTNGQTLRSSDTGIGAVMGGVVALISANSHGLPYTISQTGTALTGSGGTIPTGACTVVPFYAVQDNFGNSIPGGAAVGAKGSWVGTRTLYTSEPAASIKIIQAHYSITDDPAAGASSAVLVSQAGGTYSGSVTFTVTA